jgi:hypothetical protein
LSVHIVLDANPDHLASSRQQNVTEDCNSTFSGGVNGNDVNLDTDFPTEGTGFSFISYNLLSFLKIYVYEVHQTVRVSPVSAFELLDRFS